MSLQESPAWRLSARGRGVLWATLAVVWLLLVASGLVVVARYDNGAGQAATAPHRWPSGSRLVRDPDLPTLVMVVHPLCTCTRASLTELAEIMARTDDRLRAYVLFAKPGRLPGEADMNELWHQAARIRNVSLVRDDDGREAAGFGAATSGQILLYDASGELLFSGGATRSRGHAGDNTGRRAIVAVVKHEQPEQRMTSVFGCALLGPADVPAARAGALHDHGDHR